MFPNKRTVRSHFVTLSHYNRLRALRSPASSHSFRSDYSETIQSASSSPSRPPQVPTQTSNDNTTDKQKSKVKPTQQAASSSSSSYSNPPKAPTPTRKAKSKKQKAKLTPTQQASALTNTDPDHDSPDPELPIQSTQSPTPTLTDSPSVFAPEVSPVLYHFDEISSAIPDPLSQHLSSWISTLRNKKVIVFRRAFNDQLTDSRLTTICKSRHSSLARLLGASLRGNHIFIVYEYVAGASLKRCLDSSSFSNWISRMRVALDVAKGLEYIHRDCDMVHNKIRSSHIILAEPNFNAKMCLFGESDLAILETELEQLDSSHCLRIEEGTCYIAPEVLAGGRTSKNSDVFAFGVLILELISGKPPLGYRVNKHTLECEVISLIETARYATELEGEGRGERIRLWADHRLQNSFQVGVMEKLIGLGLWCAEADPSKRPEMVSVVTTISKLFLQSVALVPIGRLLSNYLECDVFPQAEEVAMGPDLSSLDGSYSLLRGFTGYKSVEFSYEELARATNDFCIANIIGVGDFWPVYHAELRGEKVAIKKMFVEESQAFISELKAFTHVHHLNLVRLIGHCMENFLFLVYELIDNGNLSQHLRGSDRDPLEWSARVQVALDSARGLEYIHEYMVPVYTPRDIKAANILLDKKFHAKVSTLYRGSQKVRYWPDTDSESTEFAQAEPTMPSLYIFEDVSRKVDVYAFGVVLYELISAKEAMVEGTDGRTMELVDLFDDALYHSDPKEHLKKLVDPRLGNDYPIDSVYKMALLAQACTRRTTSMQTVVVALTMLLSSTQDWDWPGCFGMVLWKVKWFNLL